MKPFDPIEYNIECAKFIGATSWQAYPENKDLKQNGILWNFPKEITLGLYRNYSTSGLKFNSDWGWRMEVIKKIESLNYKFTLGWHATLLISFVQKTPSTLSLIQHDETITRKEAVVQAIWEFLNWYKTQQS